jgi:peptidylprolyl isomerase
MNEKTIIISILVVACALFGYAWYVNMNKESAVDSIQNTNQTTPTEQSNITNPDAATQTGSAVNAQDMNQTQPQTTEEPVTELKANDVVVGTGDEAQPGDTVFVHYTGKLTNGQVFDSSIPRGQPFSFTLGSNTVIQGWEIGIQGMKVGGKRTLTIPPSLGYGAQGAGGVIPPNATLIFDVEMLKIEKKK